MNSRRTPRHLLVAILVGLLVGGGLMSTTPAGAQVAEAAATNWKKIWKKKIQPHADKRYYTKAASDAKYTTKAETSSGLANYYTKADADARYQPKGSYAPAGSSYTKAESDGRYARSTSLVRGSYMILHAATAPGQADGTDISFGTTFSTAPVVHIIPSGAPVPAGCAGNVNAPDAAPGHLCVFGSLASNVGPVHSCKTSTASCFGSASDPWGASIFTNATAAGLMQAFGTWAARPAAVVPTAQGFRGGSSTSPSRAPMGSGAR